MKIILLEDVKKLGKKGDWAGAADGYTRNYLLPGNLAEDNSGGIKQLKQEKAALENKRKREGTGSRDPENSLKQGYTSKSGDQGKLFGSVTQRHIRSLKSNIK